MSSQEHILSPSSGTSMVISPPQNLKKGVKPKRSTPKGDDLSILNTFRHRWFLSRTHLLANVISAQKAEDGNISWVEFTPQYHSHLVNCAIALVPHPVLKVEKVLFGYILELLNQEGSTAFFELQKGGRKADKAQKEKKRPARKRSHAVKRKAAKVAKLPPRERQCLACGCKFKSRKTATKHTGKCPKSKVQHWASQPPHPLPMHPLPQHIVTSCPVTGDSRDPPPGYTWIVAITGKDPGFRRQIRVEEIDRYMATGLWRLG